MHLKPNKSDKMFSEQPKREKEERKTELWGIQLFTALRHFLSLSRPDTHSFFPWFVLKGLAREFYGCPFSSQDAIRNVSDVKRKINLYATHKECTQDKT